MPVHPEYVAFLQIVAAAAPPAGAEIPVADSRANYRAMRPATPELAVAAVRDRTIPGPAGAIPIHLHAERTRAISDPRQLPRGRLGDRRSRYRRRDVARDL